MEKKVLKVLNEEKKVIRRMKNGAPVPGPGRPKGLKNDPIKKARKQLIEEYKDALALALPIISPVLIKKAFKGTGDLGAIKEINDILVDKAPRKIIGDSENPLIVQISQEAAKKYDSSSDSK